MNLYSVIVQKDIKLLDDYLMVNDINELNEQGRSGLHAAVSNDFPDGVKCLLENNSGYDVNI